LRTGWAFGGASPSAGGWDEEGGAGGAGLESGGEFEDGHEHADGDEADADGDEEHHHGFEDGREDFHRAVEFGVCRDCFIRNAIIDKNARIGDGGYITPDGKPDGVHDFFTVDGLR
jgi:hypothetical protein